MADTPKHARRRPGRPPIGDHRIAVIATNWMVDAARAAADHAEQETGKRPALADIYRHWLALGIGADSKAAGSAPLRRCAAATPRD